MIPNFMKKKLQLTLYINLIFLIILSLNTQKLLADEMFKKGREIFLEQGTCASCHTLDDAGSQANIGPNLNEIRPDLNRVIIAVTNGMGVMPSFDGILTAEEINSVAHYVYTATE
jgi:mono/diheme cytochrome c family protein